MTKPQPDPLGGLPWTPDCAIAVRLCIAAAKAVETDDGVQHQPALWVWAMWRPTGRPMPFRLPEEFGLHCDDPYFEIEALAQPDRLYWMHHSEADWSAMLMLIQSQAPHRESWQRKAVESARLKANKKRPIELMGAYEQADNQESKGAPAKPVAPPQLDPVAQAAFQRFVRNALKFNPEGNNFAD